MSAPPTTHVLDTARAGPPPAVAVRCPARGRRQRAVLGAGHTDDDGRIKHRSRRAELEPGTYRLVFDTAAYHESGHDGFFPEVIISFTVTDPQQHHHVPLLLAPFAYSTYRGS